jgi:hypothetical protein
MSLMRDASFGADSLQDHVEIPRDSYDLINLLDKAYPHRCLALGESPEAAHRYAGARELIDELIALKQEELEGQDEDEADSTE